MSIDFFGISKGDGTLFLFPTIKLWRTDFKKYNILPYVAYGVALTFLDWYCGFSVNIK